MPTDDVEEELGDYGFDGSFAEATAKSYLNYINSNKVEKEFPVWDVKTNARKKDAEGKIVYEKKLVRDKPREAWDPVRFATREQIKAAVQRYEYEKALATHLEAKAKVDKYSKMGALKGLASMHKSAAEVKLQFHPKPTLAGNFIPNQYKIDWYYQMRNRPDVSAIIGNRKDARLYEPAKLEGKKVKKLSIACDFLGVLQIVENDTADYYIPTSYHCALKVANKVAELEGWDKRIKLPVGKRQNMTSNYFYKEVKKTFEWNKFPKVARWNSDKQCFTSLSNAHETSSELAILLIEVSEKEYKREGEYHAILAKKPEIAASLKSKKYWSPSDYKKEILDLIKLEKSKTLNDDQVQIIQPKGKSYINKICLYDIETYNAYYLRDGSFIKMDKSEAKEIDLTKWMLVPIALAYKFIDITTDEPIKVTNDEVLVGEDCWDRFVDILAKAKDLPLSKVRGVSKPVPTIYLYAHNGGGFDHIYAKSCEKLKFIDGIVGHTIKMLLARIVGSDNYIVMHDSLLFTQASLENSAKFFNTPRKIKFDIEHMTREDYALTEDIPPEELDQPNDSKETREWKTQQRTKRGWRQYLKRDVECLAEIMRKLERYLRTYGCSASNYCGIPGVAWDVMNNDCIWMKDVHIAVDVVTCDFIRQMCMGGRLMHFMKLINWSYNEIKSILGDPSFKPIERDEYMTNEVFVALDANSLYPSAMQIGQFPVGKFEIITNPTRDDVFKLIKQKKLFAAEVEFDPGNVRYPLIPYKTFDGNLIYPANHIFTYKEIPTIFRGVYTSVEIMQAICLGYKVVNGCHNLIYWPHSERIFENLINKLYDERNKLKKEGNPMEHLCKILLNSLYGKTLEIIRTGTVFVNDPTKTPKRSVYFNEEISKEELPNGQTELRLHLLKPKEMKPVQLGAFILSYARAIMNEIIIAVGPENIAYSDTDSIYVRKSALDNFQVKAKMHNELGGFKNDYGETAVITKAMIVDIKRYLLELKYDPKEVESRGKKEVEMRAIWEADKENLEKLRNYEKAKEKNDFPRLKAKFTGITFKKGNALQNWDHYGSLTDYENLYAWFIANPGETTNFGIIQDKWIRNKTNVCINTKELEFSANPQARGTWIHPSELVDVGALTESGKVYKPNADPKLPRLEFYPIGYDHSKKERKMSFELGNLGIDDYKGKTSFIDEMKLLHSPDYHIKGNKLKSRHILKHPDKVSDELYDVQPREAGVNKDFESSFVTGVDEKEDTSVFMMEKDFKGNVSYFKTGKYGRTCKVPDDEVAKKMNNRAFLITLPASMIPHGINLSEQETEKIHKEISRLIKAVGMKQSQ